MNWSFSIGHVYGIKLRIHWTFLLLLGWIFAADFSRNQDLVTASVGVAFIVVLFGCVLLHELGHALTARRYDCDTEDITLLPIGGVARLKRIPENPVQEFWVAVAGPAVNVVIAGVLTVFLGLLVGLHHVFTLEMLSQTFLGRLLLVNISLVVFNMLPAFPMDGGRVLRALLATQLDYVKATQIAANVGQYCAIALGALGLMSNGFLVFIALFVYFAAREEANSVRTRALLKGVPVRAAMIRHFQTLDDTDSLGTAAGELLSGEQTDFPVLADGRLVGVLTRGDLLNAIKSGDLNVPVAVAMSDSFSVATATEDLAPVVARMNEAGSTSAPVVDHGNVVGVVTLNNVGEWIALQDAVSAATNVDMAIRARRPSAPQVAPLSKA